MVRPRRSAREWRRLAVLAVRRTVELRDGAVVWPELEGLLAHREGWADEHISELRDVRRIDPHHLATARALLLNGGQLVRTSGKAGGRDVPTWVEGAALEGYGRRTAVTRAAGRKRRLYGTLLGWTGRTQLCGRVAERQVAATLEQLAGRAVWLDSQRGAGEVRELDGTTIPGGPLDHAGAIARDPAQPNAGFVGFAIEVKNVRQTLYPEHREIYDLLWKVGHFPDRVAILIAPRLHWTTFVLFKAVGALAYTPGRQWFAGPPGIPDNRFRQVRSGLAIPHMEQLQAPDHPSRAMIKWFTTTLHRRGEERKETLLETSAERWTNAAPILAQAKFQQLREQLTGQQRRTLYRQLLDELYGEGLAVDRLLPWHEVYETEEHDIDLGDLDPDDYE